MDKGGPNLMELACVLWSTRYLLKEAKQRVPPFLERYTSELEKFRTIGGIVGCAYCGGTLYHTIKHRKI